MLNIVFISSGQPSANPRLVKEATALQQAGYTVTVIYVPISPWADAFDALLFQKYPQIKFIQAGYHPHRQKWLYKWARVRRKLLATLFRKVGDILNIVDYSTILFGQELLKTARQHKADLYIAHNLGALPVAVKAARLHKAKVGFDAEDFHRGEFATDSLEKQQTEFVENKYLPVVDYLTVASPLIGETYKNLFPGLYPLVINNVFPLSKLTSIAAKEKPEELRLFWFSQKIGKNRGLENVIKAMGLMHGLPVSLTLLGNLPADIKEYFFNITAEASVNADQLQFLAPIPEDELFKIAAHFDIGIGSEPGKDKNNHIALSNKIFTYLLAGNALVLSDTEAQSRFLEENAGVGSLYKNDNPESLVNVLKKYIEDPELLKMQQQHAKELAETKYNWEMESQKFLNLVRTTLQP